MPFGPPQAIHSPSQGRCCNDEDDDSASGRELALARKAYPEKGYSRDTEGNTYEGGKRSAHKKRATDHYDRKHQPNYE
jgi:hypothetical protein